MLKFFNQKQLAMTLLCVMVTPFLIFIVCLLTGSGTAWMPAPVLRVLHIYGILCVTFFAGIQWGVHFCKRTVDSVYLLGFLTILIAWLSLLSPGTAGGLLTLLLAFLLSWYVELGLSRQRVTTAWFWQLRCLSMIIIVATVVLASIFSIVKNG